MTIREYIEAKVGSFGLTEAHLLDISSRVDIEAEYTPDAAKDTGLAICDILEEIVLSPKIASISESGFSQSWDYSNLGKLYMYLCRKYRRTPNSDVLSMLGISVIADRTGRW